VAEKSRLAEILRKDEATILREWIDAQVQASAKRMGEISRAELTGQAQEFYRSILAPIGAGDLDFYNSSLWKDARDFLTSVSRSHGTAGFTPSETANFVMSLKKPIFGALRKEFAANGDLLADEIWKATTILDTMGLFTTEIYQKTREEVILRQQEDMLELSTPVVKLWDGILALPIIGTLDSSRTQVVMESLLQKIVETNSDIAIIDITGVPTVDTLVAQHLIKTVTAARLMGAECIISGIRPQIAATIVHLGVDLAGIATKASLADAFKLGLQRVGRSVQKNQLRGS
jgi:rsbT co-antagonist protein RsbR